MSPRADPADNLAELRDALRGQFATLAEALLGEPNRAVSTRRTLRWGRKGSLAAEIAGRKAGQWFCHEAGRGGGPIELIQHARGGSVADAIAWARHWVGQPTDTPRPPPHRAEAKPEADAERQANIAAARRLWTEAGPIAGTLGEKYLVGARKIPIPPDGWPGMTIRYHARLLAIILAATRDDGSVQAVQLIRLNRAGGKADDGRPVKLSRGPQDGALVRLPGDPAGPLLIAEGPETGLSAWRATWHETWVALGSMAKAELPHGRRVVICADDDPRRAKKGESANAAKTLRRAVAGWRQADVDVVVAYPWPIRRGDKSDLNDTLQAGGIEAVQARIAAALHPVAAAVERVPVRVARAKLAEAMAGFVPRALAWVPPDDDAPPALPPPVEMIRVDVGAGKSDAARRGLVRLVADLRARQDRRNVAIAVPTHVLGDEQAAWIMALPEAKAAGLVARVWRGRKAIDPEAPGETMCRDLAALDVVEGLGLDPQTSICRRKLPNGTVAECPFFAACGYQRQREARADVWVGAHNLLFTEKPAALGKLATVVVDESFWEAGLRDETQFPLDWLGRVDTVPGNPIGTQRLSYLRRLALDALRDHDDGAVLRERLLETGMTAESASEGYALEWQLKIEPRDIVPGMSRAARAAAARAAEGNKMVMRRAGFWAALRALLADGGPASSGWLALDHDDDGVRVLWVKGRRNVTNGWQVPTLILDAILRPELVLPFYPQARLVADLAVAAPHQRVRQVTDRAYSLAMLKPLDPERAAADPEEARRRLNRLRDVRVQIDAEARRLRPGRVLVVVQKTVEEALKAMGPLPSNVDMAHHNAIAGRDEWRDVRGLVLIGRTMPAPGSVGALAEALSGSHVPLLVPWYQRADATRETLAGAELAEADRHPDPLAEAIRWQICEGELVQIIGRGRGVNRTAADPLDVLVLCDVPLPLPVAETMPATALDPTLPERMLAEGGVAFEGPADAARAYPGLFPTHAAAKMRFHREQPVTTPYGDSIIGECYRLVRVAYQRAGERQHPAAAWIDAEVVPDAEAWLGDRLGPLAWCRASDPRPLDPPVAEPVPPVPVLVAEHQAALAGLMRAALMRPPSLPCTPLPLAAPVAPPVYAELLPPATFYRPGALERPPTDILRLANGFAGRPVALIETHLGPFMVASAPRGLALVFGPHRPVMPAGLLMRRAPPYHASPH